MRLSPLLAAIGAALPVLASAQTPAGCAALADDAQRLACYDTFFRATSSSTRAAASAASASAPAPVIARDEPTARNVVATAPSGGGLAAEDYLAKFWELDRQRDTFVVRTYGPNFILPLHYTTQVNRSPTSPTHPDGGTFPYGRSEAELQVSLRAKAFGDVFFHNDSFWFAYTQQSLWQLWNSADSSPFRSSDYQPEAMYVTPIPDTVGTLAGWRWRMLLAGFAHESNGQSDPLSRSWNRLYLGTAFTRDDIALEGRFNWRTPETGVDDNPQLTDYIGNTELSATWFPGVSTMQLTARTSFESTKRGSLKFTWTHPLFPSKPDGLRLYLQLFSGYGETLLDYNHRQNSVGIGFTLFQL